MLAPGIGTSLDKRIRHHQPIICLHKQQWSVNAHNGDCFLNVQVALQKQAQLTKCTKAKLLDQISPCRESHKTKHATLKLLP